MLHALLQIQHRERLLVVMDSEYIYKGVTAGCGLEPMEDPALTSGDDSGGTGATEPEVDTSLEEASEESASDGFSTDVSDRATERAQGVLFERLGVGYGLQHRWKWLMASEGHSHHT